MRAVAYARVSSDSDEQKHSLQTQMDYFKGYFQSTGYEIAHTGALCKRNGMHVAVEGIYADEGISGTSLKRRDAFNLMIEHAKQGKFDIIFTKSISRFGRSVEDNARIIKDLKEYGVGVYFLDINTSTLDSSKEVYINIFSALAQEESRHKSDIVQFGIRKAQRDGKWISTAPFGYDKVEGKLQLNANEVQVVRKIFDMYQMGYGTGKIARELTAQGIKTKHNKQWSQTQVCAVLDNPIYVGRQVTHRFENTDINRKLQRNVPEEEHIVNLFEHLRIIDDEVFNYVQAERVRRKEYTREGAGRSRYSNQTLFSNLLYCRSCGGAMKRKKRHSRNKDGSKKDIGYEWRCRNNDMYGAARCPDSNSVIEEQLIQWVTQELVQYKFQKHEYTLEHYLYTYLDKDEKEQQLKEVVEQLNELKTDMDANFKLYSTGHIDEEQFSERNLEHLKRKKALTADYNRLMHIEDEIERTKTRFDEFVKFLRQVNPHQLDNHVLKRLISGITVFTIDDTYPDFDGTTRGIEIDWAFLDKTEMNVISDMAEKDIANWKAERGQVDDALGDFDPEDLPFPND